MNICWSGHEEIVYQGRVCPVCILVSEIDDLKREVEELEKELEK